MFPLTYSNDSNLFRCNNSTAQQSPLRMQSLKRTSNLTLTAHGGEPSPSSVPTTEKVAIFIGKTFNLVSQAAESGIAGWTQDGRSLIINDVANFTLLLPNFFRHANFRSFIRQLNCYGFRKFRTEEIRQLSGTGANAEAVFHHPFFQRGRKDLLAQIRIKREGESAEIDELRAEISSLQEQVAVLTNVINTVIRPNKRRRDFKTGSQFSEAVVDGLEYSARDQSKSLKRMFLKRNDSMGSTELTDESSPKGTGNLFGQQVTLGNTTSMSLDKPVLMRQSSSFTLELDALFHDGNIFTMDSSITLPIAQENDQTPPPTPELLITEQSMENLYNGENSTNTPPITQDPSSIPNLRYRISTCSIAADP